MPLESNDKPDPEDSPAVKQARNFSQQNAMAMELPFIFVGCIVVGGAIGYFLDAWLHTKPVMMIVFGVIGFIAGLRDILRRTAKG
jgi:F0F1-type ATP synthase assembly protein I